MSIHCIYHGLFRHTCLSKQCPRTRDKDAYFSKNSSLMVSETEFRCGNITVLHIRAIKVHAG